ncbi:(1-_4)-alpha-D-glucan 1-alpha-D-glucosylmutase [Halopseudomonas sabulinigri]|uniref:(1->4)-alpha-D-glucan 1-alpha-D-glucosylmutase n=1 Tax=Halopseudomonas sabulinigri TaxID=472181 RepID=A0A1H1PC33_9GAMM|nr:malto-oligosyltrehalose synthase [Halopseudomonas sabulinigri]SDS08595.1 (1->4)-alpha-D-glucan 1-alpha-D-glucosylmutase [Halopseudomonas sabulinigri]
MNELNATIRLQCHSGFTLDDAAAQVNYFARLGITHLYLSPILQARAGSTHGYDVVDPTCVSRELGGEAALQRLVSALRAKQMGLIVDIVPNHMHVADSANLWWQDVLEWGPASRWANYFDIDWQSPSNELRGKVLIPVLDGDLEQVIRQQQLQLHFSPEKGRFHVKYFDHHLPLCPVSYAQILQGCEEPQLVGLGEAFVALEGQQDAYIEASRLSHALATSCQQPFVLKTIRDRVATYNADTGAARDSTQRLLADQHYWLNDWRSAQKLINWRRFFDINQLGALRVEDGEVFEATHAKIFELIERGLIDGVRVDHIDGLADPAHYCRRLRRRLDRLQQNRPADLPWHNLPIYVEKILASDETLPKAWPVEGTTGYEFMNEVSLLLHDPDGAHTLRQLWKDCTGRSGDFLHEVHQARAFLLDTALQADFDKVARSLSKLANNVHARQQYKLDDIRRVLREILLQFPVYRLYAGSCGRSPEDEEVMRQVVEAAREALAEADWPLLEQMDHWLGGQPLYNNPPGPLRKLHREVLTRFHQLTAPLAAKAVEDTAFYRHAVSLSRNDVGFDPEHLAMPVTQFHEHCQRRAQQHPLSMLTTATHDNKRGEDLRARLAVISGSADWYASNIKSWMQQAAPLRRKCGDQEAPAPHDEVALYQMLLGGWPLHGSEMNEFLPRLQQWQQKALREAKLQSSWWRPNEEYERACADFVARLLDNPEHQALRQSIESAALALAPAGALNSLAQTLLRLTTPGIPDLYQGCELWDFSFVDPDNRRPVDFTLRATALGGVDDPKALLENWRDGKIKQWLIATVLQHRLGRSKLYREGRYLPLAVHGEQAEHLIAFARARESEYDVVVAPRLPLPLLDGAHLPLIPAGSWGDTWIELPPCLPENALLQSLFCNTDFAARGRKLPAQVLLERFPVQVLCLNGAPAQYYNEQSSLEKPPKEVVQ